ncbi:MAG TPA: hypothetical protein VGH46_09190 [Gaiellaceae bacterium]|jgi:hypothetical protein
MAESPEEKQALEKLDEETREVSWGEFDKEADRELNTRGLMAGFIGGLARFGRPRRFHRVKGDPVLEPVDDEDPGEEHALRDALRGDDEKA